MNALNEWIHWTLISSFLDVVLVSFLIYRMLVFVRGTRALPMLAGLGIVVLVYVVSVKLNLVTLSWILGKFLGSVPLVVVVLFQDDLRRALIKVGLVPGFGAANPGALEFSIAEVAKAATELASKRIGALIVLKRDIGLEEYTEHAVRMDCVVSHQMLVSVFQPTSPLHDGAVAIDGNRIVAAGAVLPLTFNPTISSFGTRHRAAIGLSEHTDAVIVVVSEETGIISLVREGRITRELTEKSLYTALHRLTVFPTKRRIRKLRSLFWFLGRREVVDADKVSPEKPGSPATPQNSAGMTNPPPSKEG